MIAPPRQGEPYPGRLPSVRAQWAGLRLSRRTALVVVPVLFVLVLLAVQVAVAATAAALLVGVAMATATFAKNRTDRHNAAVDRGEISALPDPVFRPFPLDNLDSGQLEQLRAVGFAPGDIGAVRRFDGGWIVNHSNPRDISVVLGDDGGCALFDPWSVSDPWAVSEYLAGRGREPLP